MALSIKNLRRGIAIGGFALVIVLAAFLEFARFKGHHFRLDLPGRLGVDISQTANGFTYSQSQRGHTLFTIHASKLVQYKGDQAELHDVTITLYGPQGSGRSDKIYGSDFTYNRKQGIARAMGAVRIDFAAPEGKPGTDPGPARASANTIHVTTSGVVFNQSTGNASTDQRVDFELTKAAGSAVGADYNAKDGVLILDQQVALTTGSTGGRPGDTIIHAEHAQLLRDTHVAYLVKADATTAGKHVTSDQATIDFRPDGSAQQIDTRGHVHLVSDDGAEVHASDALIDLDALSHPLTANLSGGVTYYSNDQVQTMQGSAVSATLAFAALPAAAVAGKPQSQQGLKHAQFRSAVTFVLQQHSLAGDRNGSSTREMSASTLDIDFVQGAAGKSEAKHLLGAGGARVNLHDVPSKAPARTTSISGEQLLATLANGREFETLDGKGQTRITDTAVDGATSTSTGDTLHVTFAAVPGAGPAAKSQAAGTAQVDVAEQTGNVVLLQTPAAGAKNADGSLQAPFQATAQRAEYHAADQLLHLFGDPHLRNGTVALSADKVDYHRDTGDASAMGNVKSTYEAQKGSKSPTLGGDGPVHVTADHAQMTRSSDLTVFYGAAATPARMWQGVDAVTAPVLELARDRQTLDAHGGPGERNATVHATLGSKAAPTNASSSAPASAQAHVGSRDSAPIRIASVTLHYADQDRRADLRGAVTAEQPSGTLHADQASVFLTPSVPDQPSQLDHMIATGHVVITQPGRRGTGDKLVYTAADGRYVLTGSPGQPPRIVDAQKGTTSGAALIFKGADDSVEVSSRMDASPGGALSSVRTVTDTHAPK